MEAFYPLHVLVCEQCFLVQLQRVCRAPSDIFTRIRLFLVLLDELGRARAALLPT